jgi:hypothetical protein
VRLSRLDEGVLNSDSRMFMSVSNVRDEQEPMRAVEAVPAAGLTAFGVTD